MDRINRQEELSHGVEQQTHCLDRILRIDEVMRTTGLGKSTIYRGMTDGSFPVSLELGERARGWRQSDIERWLSERPATRLAATGGGTWNSLPFPDELAHRAAEMKALWDTMDPERRAFMRQLWEVEDKAIEEGRAPDRYGGRRKEQ